MPFRRKGAAVDMNAIILFIVLWGMAFCILRAPENVKPSKFSTTTRPCT